MVYQSCSLWTIYTSLTKTAPWAGSTPILNWSESSHNFLWTVIPHCLTPLSNKSWMMPHTSDTLYICKTIILYWCSGLTLQEGCASNAHTGNLHQTQVVSPEVLELHKFTACIETFILCMDISSMHSRSTEFVADMLKSILHMLWNCYD